MNRIGAILMTVAVVGALLAVPLGVSAAAAQQTTTSGANSSVAPGERLAGALGVQEATVGGDLSERTYEVRLRNADSDEQRADIVAERRAEIEQRLETHSAELAELRAARDAGNISEGTYRARVATVAAETSSTERAAQRAGATARQLPEAVLDERGINVTALDELRTTASELGGEETAEIARDIAGRNRSAGDVGGGAAAGGSVAAGERPGGPPEERPSRGEDSGEEDRPGARETIQPGNTNPDRVASDSGSPGDTPASNAERNSERDSQQNGANRENPPADNRSSNSQPTVSWFSNLF